MIFYKKREWVGGKQFLLISFMKYSNNIMEYDIIFNKLKFIW